ncbi:ABC transporter ATP-binding protein [Celerinatantimonas sp. MCCC 1A17872]|uniref:ABC transporter ATP-binding protein n=1 Tax=Celerinatantimonas sp. MCCC 1A17872 TaxID=3177514 RepID=UPI0038C0D629
MQLLVIISSICELASIFTIGPFMAIVGNSENLNNSKYLSKIFELSHLSNRIDFLFYIGIGVLLILAGSALLSMYTTYKLSLFGARISADLSARLYKYYICQPWLFHASQNSSSLTNKLAQESIRISTQIIQPLLTINSKVMIILGIVISLIYFNPEVAILSFFLFFLTYVILYRVVKNKLYKSGQEITKINGERFKLMNEGFGGVKDILLLGRQHSFYTKYESESIEYGKIQGIILALSQIPKYAIEFVAYGSIIFLVLYLIKIYNGHVDSILSTLSIYALAGFKLLPSFQQVYVSITQIKANISAFENLKNDLYNSSKKSNLDFRNTHKKLDLTNEIELRNINFKYLNKKNYALKNINIKIDVNTSVGFVGASGSGKSTLIDILLGLIQPSYGSMIIDGKTVTKGTLRNWQNNIGFVPQSIFLSDASIRENIAFGIDENKIDDVLVDRAINIANLNDFIDALPEGKDSIVGERGVQISGGQRQRIGIARALYNNADVLVLDEATSALDGITEGAVMNAISNFFGVKTIIIVAHRLSTIMQCDKIYLMDSGNIIDSGSYNELKTRSDIFQKMVNSNVIK